MTDWMRSERFALIISLSSLPLPGHASKGGVRDLQLTRSSVTELSNVARNVVFDWL